MTTALRITVEMPEATWSALVAAAPIDAARRERLLSADEPSLDRLAAELNEFRCIM
ncbi:MAG: hypothetical protein ABI894_09540 [Ilumatobacteraceae bacterium]